MTAWKAGGIVRGCFGKIDGYETMLKLNIGTPGQKLNILCIGAHSDDIEIGCGGTILRVLEENAMTEVDWIVFSGAKNRASEAQQSADSFLEKAHRRNIVIKQFRDSYFPYIGCEIKEYFQTLPNFIQPDIVFTHYQHDRHQDHRLLSELTWNAFRDHLIFEYEITKWDGDLGQPNAYMHLGDRHVDKKANIIMDSFASQRFHDWFTKDTFLSLMRLRGMESRAPGHYAEAFYCRKAIF